MPVPPHFGLPCHRPEERSALMGIIQVSREHVRKGVVELPKSPVENFVVMSLLQLGTLSPGHCHLPP
jgi:hypothetical protein